MARMESSTVMRCQCPETDPLKLRRCIDSENRLIGVFCTVCEVEYLTREYHIDNHNNTDSLLPRQLPTLDENTAFQVQSNKQNISRKHFADILKPGDHISWHRPYVIWHHAIVTEVSAEEGTISVIHWTKDGDGAIRIISDTIVVKEESDKMYRIDYPEEILNANNTELVLARARSRIGDTGYNFFTQNCESFATYCKCGVVKSHQFAWLKAKLTECATQNIAIAAKASIKCSFKIMQTSVNMAKQALPSVAGNVPQAAGSIVPAEAIEAATRGTNWVGAGIVIIIEGGFIIWDLQQACKEREKGTTSRIDFIELVIQRLVEGIAGAGLTIACSLGPELIGCAIGAPLGPVGILVGGIIGGVVGGAIGKTLGTALGSWIGRMISSSLKADDRAVTKIDDLKPGDHIIFYAWILHPRCHAIVIDHDGVGKIKVIHNSYKKGVVEKWVPFSQPLYRVEYAPNTCNEPDDVIRYAMEKLGEKEYNLATYNCKTFARKCKSKSPTLIKDEPWEMINHEDIPKEIMEATMEACNQENGVMVEDVRS